MQKYCPPPNKVLHIYTNYRKTHLYIGSYNTTISLQTEHKGILWQITNKVKVYSMPIITDTPFFLNHCLLIGEVFLLGRSCGRDGNVCHNMPNVACYCDSLATKHHICSCFPLILREHRTHLHLLMFDQSS